MKRRRSSSCQPLSRTIFLTRLLLRAATLQHDWPLERPFPELFYFPASLEERSAERAAMHAKVIIVDNAQVFISSANFTEAAQERNIEIGIVIRSKALADQLTKHFASMLAEGTLKMVFDTAARERT